MLHYPKCTATLQQEYYRNITSTHLNSFPLSCPLGEGADVKGRLLFCCSPVGTGAADTGAGAGGVGEGLPIRLKSFPFPFGGIVVIMLFVLL